MLGDNELLLFLRGVTVPSEVESTLLTFLARPFFLERETFSFPVVLVRVTADTTVGRAASLREDVHQAWAHQGSVPMKTPSLKGRVIAEGFV